MNNVTPKHDMNKWNAIALLFTAAMGIIAVLFVAAVGASRVIALF